MKLTNINNNNALELAIEDYCKHIEEIKERYVNTKIVKKNKGLT